MIAIIGAMDIEVQALCERMSDIKVSTKHGVTFYEGKLSGKNVVVTLCGIGMCSAAISTTILLENYDITGVVNFGTAGGLKDHLEVLDVIVGENIANYEIDVPGWDNNDFDKKLIIFKSDERFISLMKEVISDEARVFVGNIASGNTFVCKDEHIKRILDKYPETLCAEMEGASIAQVCTRYEIPFIVIRSLSDIAIKDGNEMTFDEYAQKASKRCALWCEKFVSLV